MDFEQISLQIDSIASDHHGINNGRSHPIDKGQGQDVPRFVIKIQLPLHVMRRQMAYRLTDHKTGTWEWQQETTSVSSHTIMTMACHKNPALAAYASLS